MPQFYELRDEYMTENELEEGISDIFQALKKKKRTYSANIFILKKAINKLENNVQEVANTTIFQ